MGQDDFRHLLNVAQMESVTPAMNSAQNVAERNHLIQSMAASDMTNLEIARQMQMTTEEVNLVLSIRERVQDKKEILL